MRKFYCLLVFLITINVAFGQEDTTRLSAIQSRLDELSLRDSTYLKEVDLCVGKTALGELLRSVANVNSVNISVNGIDQLVITCNFSRARITDLLYFLCSEYSLELDIIGNIVSIRPYRAPQALLLPPMVDYHESDSTISYDLLNHSLIDVAKIISQASGQNLVIPQSLYTRQISGYVRDMPVDEAIVTLAATNELAVESQNRGVWSFRQATKDTNGAVQQYVPRHQFSGNELSVDSLGLVSAMIGRGNVSDIIGDLCNKLKVNYFFVTPITQQTSLFVKGVTPEMLLNVMLSGTPFSYYVESGVYMFGTTVKAGDMVAVKMFRMKYRTVNKVVDVIPTAIKAGVQVQMFADLNSVIIAGDQRQVSRVVSFLESIDINIPLVTIEVIILDARKNFAQEVGLTAGFGKPETQTYNGSLSPGININAGSQSINSLISGLNGFGSINLGKVPTDFYLNLKLMEDAGTIELRSTPKLSTLNGHEATLKSGETKYYKEVMNNIIGTQNPIQSESFTWKSVEANLSLTITPYVSQDNQITLEIDIEQSEFTAREEKDAPPGTATRKFKSIIRVQNEDMVLLGGIERNNHEKSSSGLPFLARVPVLKWLFGTSKNNKSTQKLNVFIKPTVIN